MTSPNRRLLTGSFSANIRDRALGEDQGGELWITPSDLSRDQVSAQLLLLGIIDPHVMTWGDLWREVAAKHPDPPMLLSDAMCRATVLEALARAGREERLGPLASVAQSPGLRHAVQRRISAWTTAERKPDGGLPRDDELTRAEWAIFRHYRAILRENGAEDAAGLAVWASKNVTQAALGRPRSLTFLDPIAPTAAQARMIDRATKSSLPIRVILPTSGDQFGDDPSITPLRAKLIDEWGFVEESFEQEKPTDLGLIESTLFHENISLPKKKSYAGLSLHRGPRGDALGLLLAREINRCLEAGTSPDDVIVLVKHWNDEALRAQEIMRKWGIPVSGGPARPLATEPIIAALLLALKLPLNDWEVDPLVRLLRNGQVSFDEAGNLADAASLIRSTRVYRGRERLLQGIRATFEDAIEFKKGNVRSTEHVLAHLIKTLDVLEEQATWAAHVSWLEKVANGLGLGARPHDAAVLEFLWSALDDHTWIPLKERPEITFSAFAREFESLSRELNYPAEPPCPGTVRFLKADEAAGTRARVMALTNLEEGTFPSRGAVAAMPDDDVFGAETVAFGRERLQFLHVLGAATDEAILLAPTSNDKGQDVLVAGFVDDLVRKLGKAAESDRFTTLTRLDPTFREHPDLAVSPSDRRVLAVAQACLDRNVAPLLSLIHEPGQRPALESIAQSLWLLHDRRRIRYFNAFDGLLSDPELVAEIQRRFGPEHTFSASALESLALCPFQFYQRFVLGITPGETTAELTVDRASQGARVHDTLEQIHTALQAEGANLTDLGRLDLFIQTHVSIELTVPETAGDIAVGLRAIEDEIVKRTLRGYAMQHRKYLEKEGKSSQPSQFEVDFGRTRGKADALPSLEIRDEDQTVRVSGKIDRIDLYQTDHGPAFRIIDYKTGNPPSKKSVTDQMLALQLPLYALAAEKFLGPDLVNSCDFGYWALKDKGFKSVTPDGKKEGGWEEFRPKVIAEVARLAGSMRRGEFPVQPKSENCTRACEYKTVCRIGEVSQTDKEVITLSVNLP